MSCPICGRIYCDHTPAERGQSSEEMLKDMVRGLPPLRSRTPKEKTIKKPTQKKQKG